METKADAQRTLAELNRIRRHTRHALDATWFSYLVFGTLCLGAAGFGALFDDDAVIGIYWAVAAPLALVVVWQFYERFETDRGVFAPHEGATGAIVAFMVVGAFGLGFAGSGDVSAIGPIVAVGLGLLAFYVLLRDPIDGLAGTAIALIAIALLAVEASDPARLAMLGEGVVLITAALAGRSRSRRSRHAGTGAGATATAVMRA